MKLRAACVIVGFLSLVMALAQLNFAQVPTQTASALPRLVRFGATVKNLNGNPLTGVVGITFALYTEQSGGAALWLETQTVTADSNGHFTAVLGSTKPDGLPAELFTSEQARWVGVQVSGQAEQPRVLLVSAPYALKAGDAETVGGLPPSAFVLVAPVNPSAGSASDTIASPSASAPPPASSNVTTTGGTVNAVPLFSTATNIQNSILTQTGTTAVNVGGKLNLPATGAGTATAGKNSRPLDFVASSFSSTTSAAVNQTFQWQAEPAANNTANPSGTLNLLYALGTAAPAETGLKLSNKGVFTFAAGQTFPGTGAGTVKSVGLTAPASDFTVSGSPVTGTGTLNMAWTVAPTSTNTANALIKRDGSGNFSAGAITVTDEVLSDVLSINSAAPNPLYVATSSSIDATAIYGLASSTTGTAFGVEGVTESSGTAYGVVGNALASTGTPYGVYGLAGNSPSGVGVFGQTGTGSLNEAIYLGSEGVGAWGDAGTSGNVGVQGTADNGIAGEFISTGTSYTLEALNFASNGYVFDAYNGYNNAGCGIDNLGNLNCSGKLTGVVTLDKGARKVALSAIESPQDWFEDAGSAQLEHGSAVVALDPDFIQTVNTGMDYKVFPVPNGDCKGLYITNKTATSFEVRELGGGTSSVPFDYRIMALRKNYENVRFADHTNDPDLHKMLDRMKRGRPQAAASHKSQILMTPAQKLTR